MKALVLAGGSGTRLWPLSRADFPKQFLKIDDGRSLLRRTVERLLQSVEPSDIIILTSESYKFHVLADLDGLPEAVGSNIVLEPASRNTAPAIALGIKYCEERLGCAEDEPLLVCPSDHIIRPDRRYAAYIRQAVRAASAGLIVTFGVRPTRPETGYGYIKFQKKPSAKRGLAGKGVTLVDRFVEKPDPRTAKSYLSSGRYLWNAGIFVFTIGTMKRSLQRHAPRLYQKLNGPLDAMVRTFPSLPNISIDYAVLEKADRVATIPLDLYWNDVGSWDSLYEVMQKDASGTVKKGAVLPIETRGSMVIGSERIIATIGLENVLVVETPDALLVSKRGDAQKVRDVVASLKKRGGIQAVESTTVYRPWGSYTVLETGPGYKLKRIEVKPKAKLSLQMHHHRSEHWVVLSGTARVSIGRRTFNVHPNESTYIPLSTKHRLENPGRVPLKMIEVQNGEYTGEDDIVRFDDRYDRK